MKLNQMFDRGWNFYGTRAQGMEVIAMQYCAILAITSIVIATIIIVFVLLFP